MTKVNFFFFGAAHFIPAGFLFVIAYVGCDVTAPKFLYSLATIVSGAIYSGALCSALDIAPNYAGTIVAFGCTFGSAGSILMFYLISSVLNGKVISEKIKFFILKCKKNFFFQTCVFCFLGGGLVEIDI